MKIATSMVKKLRITDIENLDPITVIAENFGEGSGKIIIECYGESWSHFWSHMGKQHTLETFFCQASDDYIAGKLCQGRTDEADWEGFPSKVRAEIIKLRRKRGLSKSEAREYFEDAGSIDHEVSAHLNSELLCAVFGDEWFLYAVGDRPTREYKYLCRIIPVVKSAFRETSQAVAA